MSPLYILLDQMSKYIFRYIFQSLKKIDSARFIFIFFSLIKFKTGSNHYNVQCIGVSTFGFLQGFSGVTGLRFTWPPVQSDPKYVNTYCVVHILLTWTFALGVVNVNFTYTGPMDTNNNLYHMDRSKWCFYLELPTYVMCKVIV